VVAEGRDSVISTRLVVVGNGFHWKVSVFVLFCTIKRIASDKRPDDTINSKTNIAQYKDHSNANDP
jgi:hypothetical protein